MRVVEMRVTDAADVGDLVCEQLDVGTAAGQLAYEIVLSAERKGWLVPLTQLQRTEADLKTFLVDWLRTRTEPPFPR